MATNEWTLDKLHELVEKVEMVEQIVKGMKPEIKVLKHHIAQQRRQVAWSNEGKHLHKSTKIEQPKNKMMSVDASLIEKPKKKMISVVMP